MTGRRGPAAPTPRPGHPRSRSPLTAPPGVGHPPRAPRQPAGAATPRKMALRLVQSRPSAPPWFAWLCPAFPMLPPHPRRPHGATFMSCQSGPRRAGSVRRLIQLRGLMRRSFIAKGKAADRPKPRLRSHCHRTRQPIAPQRGCAPPDPRPDTSRPGMLDERGSGSAPRSGNGCAPSANGSNRRMGRNGALRRSPARRRPRLAGSQSHFDGRLSLPWLLAQSARPSCSSPSRANMTSPELRLPVFSGTTSARTIVATCRHRARAASPSRRDHPLAQCQNKTTQGASPAPSIRSDAQKPQTASPGPPPAETRARCL